MSSHRRRRVMVDSDDEGGDKEEQTTSSTPAAPQPAEDPPKKRRLQISAMDDEEGAEGQALDDSSDEDETERKRRRQLAERWFKLENDSDHDLSSDTDGGSGDRGTRKVQLQFRDDWLKGASTRKTSRLLMEQPRSAEEDSESDGLDGFIVSSPSDEEASTARRTAKCLSLTSSPSDRRRSGSNSSKPGSKIDDGAAASSRGGGSSSASGAQPSTFDAKGSRSRRDARAGRAMPAGEAATKVDPSKSSKKRTARGSGRKVPASSSASSSDEDEDQQGAAGSSAGSDQGNEGNPNPHPSPGPRKSRLRKMGRAVAAAAGAASSPDSPSSEDGIDGVDVSEKRSSKGKGKRRGSRSRYDRGDGPLTRGRSGAGKDPAGGAAAVTSSAEGASTRAATRRRQGKARAVVNVDDSEEDEDHSSPSAKVSSSEEEWASAEGQGAVSATAEGGEKSQRRKRAKRKLSASAAAGAKKRKSSASSADPEARPAAGESRRKKARRRGTIMSYTEKSDEEDASGASDKDRNEEPIRCAVDSDADEDDTIAENLQDDEDEVGSESVGRRRTREPEASESGMERRRRRRRRYEESEDEVNSSDPEEDYDSEQDEGDTSFSHAALFHELEQSHDKGVSSLSLETMTLRDAFLFYVEYLAKATAGGGAGEAFMKEYVAQPMLPAHARYGKAREMVEKKICISRESLCGTWRQDFRDSVLTYPHYGYQHVDSAVEGPCSACNRTNKTAVVAYLAGSTYDPRRVWDGLRWDKYLPEHWDDREAMAISKQEARDTHRLGDTCKHKSHLYHSLVHYKLYLVSKVAEKMRANDDLEPENFRGEGGPRISKKRKKRLLNFTENEYESLTALLDKADELNGVKWGARAGLRGGGGRTFLQTGAASSIVDWLSGEARPGQFAELDLRGGGSSAGQGAARQEEEQDDQEEEAEFTVGRGRRWETVGSSGGRYE